MFVFFLFCFLRRRLIAASRKSAAEMCCLALNAHRGQDSTTESSLFADVEQSANCPGRKVFLFFFPSECFYDVMWS